MKINTVIFTGHLGRDPEEVQTASRTLTKGRLAVGQGRDKPTIWLDLACWSKYASEDLLKARKGDCVTVSGRLTLREWTDKDANKRQDLGISCETVEVHAGPDAHDMGASARPIPSAPTGGIGTLDPDNDIPF